MKNAQIMKNISLPSYKKYSKKSYQKNAYTEHIVQKILKKHSIIYIFRPRKSRL